MLIIVPFKCEKNNNCLNSLMMIRLWWYLCNYVDINYHLYDAYKDGISPSYIEPCPLAPYPGGDDDMICNKNPPLPFISQIQSVMMSWCDIQICENGENLSRRTLQAGEVRVREQRRSSCGALSLIISVIFCIFW